MNRAWVQSVDVSNTFRTIVLTCFQMDDCIRCAACRARFCNCNAYTNMLDTVISL